MERVYAQHDKLVGMAERFPGSGLSVASLMYNSKKWVRIVNTGELESQVPVCSRSSQLLGCLPEAQLAHLAHPAPNPLHHHHRTHTTTTHPTPPTPLPFPHPRAVSPDSPMQLTYKDVSQLQFMFIRDYKGGTVTLDFTAPSLGTGNCYLPPG